MPIEWLARGLSALIACLHLYFFWMESYAWKRVAPRAFGLSKEFAEQSATLASNQGLYNGILAGGLAIGAFWPGVELSFAFRAYFLLAVMVAGAWGGATVSPRIFYIQAIPAAFGVLATLLAPR
jgi:putative membrane protein